MNVVKFGQLKFDAYDSILLTKIRLQIVDILEKYLLAICFIDNKRYAMEDMSMSDLISHIYIKLYANRFNLCTLEK